MAEFTNFFGRITVSKNNPTAIQALAKFPQQDKRLSPYPLPVPLQSLPGISLCQVSCGRVPPEEHYVRPILYKNIQ